MGAAGSGAQDANGFSSAMKAGYIPEVGTLTYQGVFNEHVYDVGEQEHHRVAATQCFPIVHDGDPWVAVFLKSMFDGKPRSTMPIDLSVVIDISGSMGGHMSRNLEGKADIGNRLDHAKCAVEWLIQEVLRSDDAIAISAFNRDGHTVQPLTRCADIDVDVFLKPVEALEAGGGTYLSSGMRIGRELLGTHVTKGRHRRIIFLTDMGEMNPAELGSLIKQNANEGVYVSIVAMGAEFNSSLTETVSKNRGSNYFCATDEAQLRQCLVDDFDFNMFPAAFDVKVSVCSGLEVAGVYGTSFDTIVVEDLARKWTPNSSCYYKPFSRSAASHLFMYSQYLRRPLHVGIIGHIIDYLEPPETAVTEVNTMFPSRIESTGAMKGGLILIRLRSHTSAKPFMEYPVQVKLSYTDVDGKAFTQMENVPIPSGVKNFMDARYGLALAKGLLLQTYTEVCRQHMQMGNDITGVSLACKQAALPSLVASLSRFKSDVEATFQDDGAMQEVSRNYEDFVDAFRKAVEYDKSCCTQYRLRPLPNQYST